MRRYIIILTASFAIAVVTIAFGASVCPEGDCRALNAGLSRSKSPDVAEESLKKFLNRTAKEVVEHFKLKDAERWWIDEPPGIVRGVTYYHGPDKKYFTLYIAEGEKLFRRFDENRKWNYEEFLACKIGGIQFQSEKIQIEVGPAVPFQFRAQFRGPQKGDGQNAGQADEEQVKAELKRFQGAWKVVRFLDYSADDVRDWRFTFEGSKVTIQYGKEMPPTTHTFTIDPSGRPKSFDLHIGKNTYRGIYKFDDQELNICIPGPKGPRPMEFKVSEEPPTVVYVLKR